MAMEWVTTSLLLDQLRDFENTGAWGQLGDYFRQPLVSFAKRMGCTNSDADDLAQETLLAFACAYRDGKYQPDKGRLSDWIFGIAFRQIQNAHRKRARHDASLPHKSTPGYQLDELPQREEATRTWGDEWARSLLARCLRTIQTEVDPKTYRAFELTVFGKQSAAVVAAELQITRNAVFKAKHHIVRRIRALKSTFESLN